MSQIKSLQTGIKFKDTPIGKIPVDWEIQPLINAVGGINDLIVAGPFGSNLKVVDYKDEGVPIIRLQNVEFFRFVNKDIKHISTQKAKELSYHSFKKGDIVLAKLGSPIGKTCIVPDSMEEGIVVADVVRISVDERSSDKKYIMYILNSDYASNQLNRGIVGTTRPRVNLGQVRNLLIPLPPLPEQKKIAEILTTVNDAIEETDRIIEKTKELKKGLMQRLFTQGIGHKKFKKTEIGKIPEEWEVGKISDYGEIVTGSTPSTLVKEYYGNDFPFVSPFDLGKIKVIIKTEKHLSKEGASVARMLPANTVLFVCIGSTIGKTGVAGVQLATNQQINAIICEGSDFNFVYYYLSFISDKIKQIAGTQAVPIVNKSLFSNVVVVIPKLDEQQEIGNILSSVDSEIEDGENHKRNLESLKKSLMQILLTGKVRVKLH